MEESGQTSNPPSQEEEQNPPLYKNEKWTKEFSWSKDMKKMTPWKVLDYNTKNLCPSRFSHEIEEMLLKEVVKYMLKSEYIYSMAYALKIPYRYMFWISVMTFKQMSMSSSVPCSLSEFNGEGGGYCGSPEMCTSDKAVQKTWNISTGTFFPSAASYPHSTSDRFPRLFRVQQRMWPRLNHCGWMRHYNFSSICFNLLRELSVLIMPHISTWGEIFSLMQLMSCTCILIRWWKKVLWSKDMKKMTPWNVLDYNTNKEASWLHAELFFVLVSMWLPQQHMLSIWTPHGIHVETIWYPVETT